VHINKVDYKPVLLCCLWRGVVCEVSEFCSWLGSLPHSHMAVFLVQFLCFSTRSKALCGNYWGPWGIELYFLCVWNSSTVLPPGAYAALIGLIIWHWELILHNQVWEVFTWMCCW